MSELSLIRKAKTITQIETILWGNPFRSNRERDLLINKGQAQLE